MVSKLKMKKKKNDKEKDPYSNVLEGQRKLSQIWHGKSVHESTVRGVTVR